MDPVEEFARLKAEVRRMEERLAVLQAGFRSPFARRRSDLHEVVLRVQSQNVFVKERLPDAILADPAFWERRTTAILTVRPVREPMVLHPVVSPPATSATAPVQALAAREDIVLIG
ncbi:MAG: hypothetical protein IAE87_05800 [Rhodobacteraceae bacterium]|jgi:hypothetical protein|nr:hypothetical protein [Paracoccaceae bacterium]